MSSDSEKGLDKIISDIARMFGKEYTFEARMKILGTPEMDTAKIAIKELGLPITVDEFVMLYREKVAKELRHPPLFPGKSERHIKITKFKFSNCILYQFACNLMKTNLNLYFIFLLLKLKIVFSL